MNKHHLEEGHSIHHVGNVNDCCCECGCCHGKSCEDFNPPCYARWGEGECLDGITNYRIERTEIEATAERLLSF